MGRTSPCNLFHGYVAIIRLPLPRSCPNRLPVMWNKRESPCSVCRRESPPMAPERTIMRPSSRAAVRPTLLTHLIRTVREQQLFVPGHHLLVAVSGGPDSVALLSLLHSLAQSWRLTLTVVHCNYGLRGEESDDDESFVNTFCQERHLPLVIRRPVLVKRRQRA